MSQGASDLGYCHIYLISVVQQFLIQMGNAQCCEEEAKGGEFVNASRSKFQTNKVNADFNKFNSINFSEPARNLKPIHEEHKPFNNPLPSPQKSPNRKWSKSIDDLPIIKEELKSNQKIKQAVEENHNKAEDAAVSKQMEKQLQSSPGEDSQSLASIKLIQQNGPLQHQSPHQSPQQIPHAKADLKHQQEQKKSEIQLPKLPNPVRDTLASQKFFENEFSFVSIRRQYETDFYEGQLDDSGRLPHGLGKYYKSDKSLYIGHFAKGVAQGSGAFIFPDGSYYYGPFNNNAAEGKGHYHSNILQYEGDFKGSCFHGFGSERGPAHEFKGEYYNGQKTNGVMAWTEDQKKYQYSGSFDHNLFSGQGTLKEPTGIYKGEFIEGKKHGYGVYEFKNGLKYKGEYRGGVREGKGALYNPSNKIAYEGEFSKGLPHGNGFILDKKGNKCATIWVQGIDSQML